ncbi:MAG: TRAP transporter small permease [Gemmobacter sp.]|jgi:TRAP-type C4-dicarboxylate transport system permease small subunit|nr:TRAP transporter small permease [Gemmobacter sp.]
MRDTFLKVYDGYGKVLWAFAILAGVLTFAIMCVIDTNAFLRKLFNWPLPAALEMTQSLLVGAIMLPFAFTLFKREHVSTVVLTSMLSVRARTRLHLFWSVVGALLFAAVTYGTFRYALRSYAMNEQTWGAGITFAIWPSKMAISLGTGLLTLQFLLDAIGYALIPGFRTRDDETEGLHGNV